MFFRYSPTLSTSQDGCSHSYAVCNYLFPCVADNKGDDMVLARYCRAVLVKLKIE